MLPPSTPELPKGKRGGVYKHTSHELREGVALMSWDLIERIPWAKEDACIQLCPWIISQARLWNPLNLATNSPARGPGFSSSLSAFPLHRCCLSLQTLWRTAWGCQDLKLPLD